MNATPRFSSVCLIVALLLNVATAAIGQAVPPADGDSIPSTGAVHSTTDAATGLPVMNASGETRGLWVVRDSLRTPQSVHQIVETARKYHINALFVQIRGRGDAWYNTPYEPRATELADRPGFDPLQQIVTEAHAAGIQVHAWMNTFLTWSSPRRPADPRHLWNAHPDWFARDNHNRLSAVPTNACEGAFLSPSNPEVKRHLLRVFTWVAQNYDVDGIHFDYCRYAGPGYDFSEGALQRFRVYENRRRTPADAAFLTTRLRTDRLAYVHAFGADWAAWRRAQVTDIVSSISRAVKTQKPWIMVSAAVFPDADDAYAERGQDWAGWLRAGYLDAVALMAYGRSTDRVVAQTRRAVALAGGKDVYTGIGAWHLSAHDVADKIARCLQAGASGVNLFSYGGVVERPAYLETLARGVFAARSAPRGFRRPTAQPAPTAP